MELGFSQVSLDDFEPRTTMNPTSKTKLEGGFIVVPKINPGVSPIFMNIYLLINNGDFLLHLAILYQ